MTEGCTRPEFKRGKKKLVLHLENELGNVCGRPGYTTTKDPNHPDVCKDCKAGKSPGWFVSKDDSCGG